MKTKPRSSTTLAHIRAQVPTKPQSAGSGQIQQIARHSNAVCALRLAFVKAARPTSRNLKLSTRRRLLPIYMCQQHTYRTSNLRKTYHCAGRCRIQQITGNAHAVCALRLAFVIEICNWRATRPVARLYVAVCDIASEKSNQSQVAGRTSNTCSM